MELFHVLNRGVDKRTIFLDDKDRARFVHDLWEFNDKEDVDNTRHRVPRDNTGLRNPYIPKERIVDVHGWCVMDNHYHLLVSEIAEGGLVKFVRRLNVGYANYFNERYKRQGTLFQGRSKKVLIERDAHFLYILHYIHLNPLDRHKETRGWRNGKIAAPHHALKYLEEYRWSSYLDYCGTVNFPSAVTTEFFAGVFKNYKKEIGSFVRDMETETFFRYPLE